VATVVDRGSHAIMSLHMKLAHIVMGLAVLAGLLLLAAGPGARLGLWHFSVGFQLLEWAAWLGFATAAAAALALVSARVRRGNAGKLAAAFLLGLMVGATPLYWQRVARAAPPIHDISTDLENPPPFVELAPVRARAPNGAAYGGTAVAERQKQAYPDIEPLVLPLEPPLAFEHALHAAREMGWEQVAAEANDGRIEATATSFWFGFKDDVVIRVSPADSGSRVDVRSKSRLGRGDAGANARRIRQYLGKLRELAS
jgi:uncharacterized protein (DUF1499 family)